MGGNATTFKQKRKRTSIALKKMAILLPFHQKNQIEAGCDEAGRGCLAGPVFAAAVILPFDFFHPLLNDSKKISEKDRDILRPIIEKEAIDHAVAQLDAPEIDKINILKASIYGMHRALDALSQVPGFILIDGNRFYPYKKIPHLTVIKGDGKYASIAAASVLAKTYRDEYMRKIALEFPMYGWSQNMGYPTLKHRDAIREFGISTYHRKSFQLLPIGEQLKLDV
jgi:ribonuclease HII